MTLTGKDVDKFLETHKLESGTVRWAEWLDFHSDDGDDDCCGYKKVYFFDDGYVYDKIGDGDEESPDPSVMDTKSFCDKLVGLDEQQEIYCMDDDADNKWLVTF